LFLWPLFKALRSSASRVTREARGLIAGLALVLGFCSFDLLMNGMFNAFPFFFAGLLLVTLNAPWIRMDPRLNRAPVGPSVRPFVATPAQLPSAPPQLR